MKSIVALLLVVAYASAASTVDFKRDGVHGASGYAFTVQDHPGVPVPYVAARGYKADQYSGVPVVPFAYPGVHGSPAYLQSGSYVAADRPVAYVAQPGYQSVVSGVHGVPYAAQPAYVHPAYVHGQQAYHH